LAVALRTEARAAHRRAAGSSAGRLETISAYKMSRGGGALELSGWAHRDEVAAECGILVDGAGTAIGPEPSSRVVPMWNRPRRYPSASSAGRASRQSQHPRRFARSLSFQVKASWCPSLIAKPSPKALRRPSAAPTGSCRRGRAPIYSVPSTLFCALLIAPAHWPSLFSHDGPGG
jgi:hypothetical protein